eukprot:363302-Chlamydomonas_euryale.AAC.4
MAAAASLHSVGLPTRRCTNQAAMPPPNPHHCVRHAPGRRTCPPSPHTPTPTHLPRPPNLGHAHPALHFPMCALYALALAWHSFPLGPDPFWG